LRILEELPLGKDEPSVHHIGGSDLCDLLGISPAMLTELKKRGIAVHYSRDAYDLVKTVRGYVTHLRGTASGRGGEEHVTSLTTERARLAKEQADAQALKNAKLRGDLVDASEVERTWSDVLRQVRARILAVPARLRADLPDLDAQSVQAFDRALRDTLMELGNADD
jgi:phage terminase Nu1 subunit (DNA packaging protein)